MTQLSNSPTMHAVMARLAARKAWEAENPELAAAWSEAMRENDLVDRRRASERDGSEAKRLALKACESGNCPPIHLAKLHSADLTREHLPKAREWLATKLPLLVLLGGVGQGKSFAACWAAWQLAARVPLGALATGQSADPVRWCRATEFARLSAYSGDDRAFFEGLCKVRVLVLDDLGAETLAGVAAAHLDELIDVRISHNRRTVLTSNLVAGAFKQRYGDRIADRIRESAVISAGSGASMRRRPQ